MKKLIVILLCISCIVCSGCNTDENSDTPEQHNYAVNEVDKQNKKEETIDIVGNTTPIVTEQLTPTPTTIPLPTPTYIDYLESPITEDVDDTTDYSTIYYNCDYDLNQSYVTDFNTISIDGNLISFPCSYSYLVSCFGTLYELESNRFAETYVPVNETEIVKHKTVYAIPQTGAGTIAFEFYGENIKVDEGNIYDLYCVGLTITGGSYNKDEKTMLCALPKEIQFGMSLTDISSLYNKPSTCNPSDNFYLWYTNLGNETPVEVDFWGRDKQLNKIVIRYYHK